MNRQHMLSARLGRWPIRIGSVTFLLWLIVPSAFIALPLFAEACFEAANEEYEVEVLDGGADCCPRTVTLAVRRRSGVEVEGTLRLTGRMTSIEGLWIVGDTKVLVVGELPWGGSSLLIGDLRDLTQTDALWAYGYSLSPSRRFVAYGTHYPRAAVPVESRRSVYLLYDFENPPESGWNDSTAAGPVLMAGVPIYPEANAEGPSVDIMAESEAYQVTSPFLWTEDEHRLVFLAATDLGSRTGARCFVVRVDLDDAWEVRSVVQDELTPENVDLSGRTVPLDHLLNQPLCLHTDVLTWTNEGRYDQVTAATDAALQLGPRVTIRVP